MDLEWMVPQRERESDERDDEQFALLGKSLTSCCFSMERIMFFMVVHIQSAYYTPPRWIAAGICKVE